MTDLLIFTDLDGTLMEHETYSMQAASEALAELNSRRIVPILNSSKTQQEMLAIQQRLGIDGPYICENGAALFNVSCCGPKKQGKVFGTPLSHWLNRVHQLRDQMKVRFEGFSDWTGTEIASLTGLNKDQAELSRQRQFSEPILWKDTAARFDEFCEALKAIDLQLTKGGRFVSIQGHFDKSTAMHWLRKEIAGSDAITVALGDSPNDYAMLNAADIAVIIKSAKSDQIELNKPQYIIRSQWPGPAGWQEAIMEILSRMDSGKLTLAR
ncbi:MAG: HAD-IIB family hydrolase [Gammaproteobacteria bacterium]|nr:HAD-IIB family hydrolase [Gammaproteobacteria bacterium]